MPVSNFNWNVTTQNPGILNVFGTKRKVSCFGEEPQDAEELTSSKRRCPDNEEESMVVHNAGDAASELNHNLTSSQNLNLSAHQNACSWVQSTELHSQPQQQPLNQQSEVNSPHTYCHSQDNMIMDINEETYSNTQIYIQQEEMARMDSDCVPDQGQYTPLSNNNMGGDIRPTEEKVKCYCRPSWNQGMEMTPYSYGYVSDYY